MEIPWAKVKNVLVFFKKNFPWFKDTICRVQLSRGSQRSAEAGAHARAPEVAARTARTGRSNRRSVLLDVDLLFLEYFAMQESFQKVYNTLPQVSRI